MINKFIVYGIPRVGSNYFISQLNFHPKILCHYEVFHKKSIYYGFGDKNIKLPKEISVVQRDEAPAEFLDFIWSNSFGMQSVGYNIFPKQNEWVLQESLKDKTIKKIILKRKDILKSFVSMQIAMKTGSWSKYVKSGEDKRIHFDREKFITYVMDINKYYNYLENNISLYGDDYLVIYYEDFLKKRQQTLNDVFTFIGEEEYAVPGNDKFGRQNPEPLSELIINYDELNYFRETHYL